MTDAAVAVTATGVTPPVAPAVLLKVTVTALAAFQLLGENSSVVGDTVTRVEAGTARVTNTAAAGMTDRDTLNATLVACVVSSSSREGDASTCATSLSTFTTGTRVDVEAGRYPTPSPPPVTVAETTRDP